MSLPGTSGLQLEEALLFERSGFSFPYDAPSFNELVVEVPGLDAQHATLVEKGILPGVPLEQFDPRRRDQLLVCVTEENRREDIDELVRELAA